MIYIYVDESGDLGEKGSKHLVLSALIVKDNHCLDRIIKNMRRNKFKKELFKAQEIKANKSSDNVRKFLLEQVNTLKDSKIIFIILEKKKIKSKFLRNNKHKLYNYVAGKLAKQLGVDCFKAIIRIDKSKGKQVLQNDFNSYFLDCLNENSNICRTEVYHSYSQNWAGLQIADILAWACFQKFEHSDNEYMDLIKIEQEEYKMW